ncbi:MAG TPA: GNAT family N-acetyltransferase [Noviherbaspirillum sp.]|jgi:hypothetical protein|uniref:GNAT family N-acetyltransferase n=1 Tax=Noviherbaspirillum sp. TaxID=1926288 RepID=UPI002F91DC56
MAETCILPDSVGMPARTRRLRWLALDEAPDAAEYERLWREGRHRRPHDSLGYLALVRPKHYRMAAVVYDHSDTARITYPFFWCELGELPHFAHLGSKRHIVSPYGYGGPLYEGDPAQKEAASRCYEQSFHQLLAERSVVSEFVREDLFGDRLAMRAAGELTVQQPNVVARLDRGQDEIWNGYKKTLRSNIRHARGLGLRVSFDREGRHLDAFLALYYETMTRRNASEFFFMSRSRFEYLTENLLPHGGIMFVHVHDGNDIIASELLLLGGGEIYSFLNASHESAFQKRPNDVMRHEIMRWGQERGMHSYVLGGGVTPGDGIYRFKHGFDPDGMLPFKTRKVVHDSDAYDALLQARRAAHNDGTGQGWQPQPDFFPAFLS